MINYISIEYDEYGTTYIVHYTNGEAVNLKDVNDVLAYLEVNEDEVTKPGYHCVEAPNV